MKCLSNNKITSHHIITYLNSNNFFSYLTSADGEYVVSTMTKAILHHDGYVKWYVPRLR